MTTAKMFMPIKFNTTIQLLPNELNKSFDESIIKKLKKNLENICTKHGFIKNNSIKIIKRSAGYFKEQHFNGYVAFDLSCIAEICNPPQDSIVVCIVKAKNTLGLLAEGIYDQMVILEVIVPKVSCGIQSEINIDNINIGDEIKVQVCGKKFILYDTKISIVGKVIKDKDNIIVVQDTDDIESEILENNDEFEIEDIVIDADIDNVGEYDEDEDDDNDSEITKKVLIIEDDASVVDAPDEDDEHILDEEEDEEQEDEFDDFDDFSGDELETDPVIFDEDD